VLSQPSVFRVYLHLKMGGEQVNNYISLHHTNKQIHINTCVLTVRQTINKKERRRKRSTAATDRSLARRRDCSLAYKTKKKKKLNSLLSSLSNIFPRVLTTMISADFRRRLLSLPSPFSSHSPSTNKSVQLFYYIYII
jgi:hypothetical protein